MAAELPCRACGRLSAEPVCPSCGTIALAARTAEPDPRTPARSRGSFSSWVTAIIALAAVLVALLAFGVIGGAGAADPNPVGKVLVAVQAGQPCSELFRMRDALRGVSDADLAAVQSAFREVGCTSATSVRTDG